MNKILTLASIVAIMFSPVAFSADTQMQDFGEDMSGLSYLVPSEKPASDMGGIQFGDARVTQDMRGIGDDWATQDMGEMSGLSYPVPGVKTDGGLDSWQPDLQLGKNIVLSGYSASK